MQLTLCAALGSCSALVQRIALNLEKEGKEKKINKNIFVTGFVTNNSNNETLGDLDLEQRAGRGKSSSYNDIFKNPLLSALLLQHCSTVSEEAATCWNWNPVGDEL